MRMQGKSSIPLRGTSGHTRHTKVQTPPGADTNRCQECLRAAPSHDVILRDDNIPQLHKSWDDNITDLVSGIPLKFLPIWEVNPEINLIDPEKRIHYQLPKCPEHFCKELSQKIERYTTAQWWYPQWHIKQCQCSAYWRKMVNCILFLIYKTRTTTQSTLFPDQDIIHNDMYGQGGILLKARYVQSVWTNTHCTGTHP